MSTSLSRVYADATKENVRLLAVARGVRSDLVYWRDTRQEGACRMCRRDASLRSLTEHHVVPLRWFKSGYGARYAIVRNVAPNRVPLCEPCHRLVEADAGARRELRRCLAPCEVAFCVQVAGRAWFDARYPASVARHAT